MSFSCEPSSVGCIQYFISGVSRYIEGGGREVSVFPESHRPCGGQTMKTCTLFLLLMLPICAVPQGSRKAWTAWTRQEAEKILNDSPWGQTQVSRNMAYEDYSLSVSRVNLRIRFLSARPIRQALLRILELSPATATAVQMDEARQFANRVFAETIVISVSYDAPSGAFPLSAYLQAFATATTSTLRNNTYLETRGGKRSFLQEYVPPGPDGLGARFIFARSVEGQLFVRPDAGFIRFYSEFPRMATTTSATGAPKGNIVTFTIDMRFKIADFLYRGVMEY